MRGGNAEHPYWPSYSNELEQHVKGREEPYQNSTDIEHFFITSSQACHTVNTGNPGMALATFYPTAKTQDAAEAAYRGTLLPRC